MANKRGRIFYSFRNVSTSFIVQILNFFIVFLSRTIFIKILGVEYLGVSGLFTSILTILSLGELGIGEAITFALYKPIKDRDQTQINILMSIFKRFYIMTSIIILLGGILTVPFLELIIGTEAPVENIRLIYMLFIINSASSYLFSYNKVLLIADQKAYKTTVIDFISNLLMNIFQIAFLIITQNYIVYLIIQIFFTLVQNILVYRTTHKEYPALDVKNYSLKSLEPTEKDRLEKNIKSLMIQKVGSVTTQGIDNIIITNVINIIATGMLSNYNLIVNYITKFVNIFFSGISASVGNLIAEGNRKKMIELFNVIYFGTSVVYIIISIILNNVLDEFIFLWVGEDYILSKSTVYIVILNFYLMGMRHCVNVFKNSMGLYWYDRYKPIISALVNIIFSIILGKSFGLIGVLIGTTISLTFVNLWIEPFVLFKYGFESSPRFFFKRYFIDVLSMLLVSFMFNIIFENIFLNRSLTVILLKIFIIVITMITLTVLLSYKKIEFRYYKNLVIKILRK